MSKRDRAATLERHRRQLLDAWKTIHDHARAADDDESAARVATALDHAGQGLPYAITGKVCAAVYAAARSAPSGVFAVDEVPYKFGFAIFDTPYPMTTLECDLLGVQWGIDADGVWLVALTRAEVLGLKPPQAVAPMSTGIRLDEGTPIEFDAVDETTHVAAIATALWRRIPRSECILIGPGKGTAVVVNHSHR